MDIFFYFKILEMLGKAEQVYVGFYKDVENEGPDLENLEIDQKDQAVVGDKIVIQNVDRNFEDLN